MNRLLNRGKVPDRVNTYGTLEEENKGGFEYEVHEYETRDVLDISAVEVDQQAENKPKSDESEDVDKDDTDRNFHFFGRTYALGCDEIKTLQFWRSILGEFLATLFLLLSCLIPIWSPDSLITVAIGSGFAFILLIYMFDSISEGFVNPAVSLALLVNGQISALKCMMYVIAQVLGATAGTGVVKWLVSDIPSQIETGLAENEDIFDRCIPKLIDSYECKGLALEFIFTSFLILQVLRCTDTTRPPQSSNLALAIGLVIVVATLCSAPFSGAAVNPARVLGPAIVGIYWDNLGFYLLVHFAASIVTPFIYKPLLTNMS